MHFPRPPAFGTEDAAGRGVTLSLVTCGKQSLPLGLRMVLVVTCGKRSLPLGLRMVLVVVLVLVVVVVLLVGSLWN